MKIPISHIKNYMSMHKNEPLPFEYAEILVGCLDDDQSLINKLREENSFLNDMLENAHNRSRLLEKRQVPNEHEITRWLGCE